MQISSCPSLIFLPKGELPTSLTRLRIANCENVGSLPEVIMHTCHLEKLDIFNCSSLTSFPRGELPSTLKELFVGSCGNLKLLPNFMQSLTSLVIRDCRNLNFQQHHMQNLTSLGNFTISKCQGLVSFLEGGLGFRLNLTHVEIEGCENLKMPLSEWGLHRLTSVTRLRIAPGGYKNVVSFSNDDCRLLLLTSLTYLSIGRFQNLESIVSLSLQTLVSLEYLHLYDCPTLQQFLPKEGLPATVGWLHIMKCPIIKKRCLKGRGQDWLHIAHITFMSIWDY